MQIRCIFTAPGSNMKSGHQNLLDFIERESEGIFRALFDNMLNGFAYCRMLYEDDKPSDFIYLAVNDAFISQTGLQEVVGKKATEIIPGIREKDAALFEIYGRVARTGEPERFEMLVGALKMWFSVSVYSPKPDHFIALFDVITERKRAEERSKRYARRLITVEEDLRKRIAMELHDGIAQQVAALGFTLGGLERHLEQPSAKAKKLLKDARAEAKSINHSVRNLMEELRPSLLDEFGLAGALRHFVGNVSKRSGISVTLTVDPDFPRLPAQKEISLFRIAQEALHNTMKHSAATKASVWLHCTETSIRLLVCDNGTGIVPDAFGPHPAGSGWGLTNMRELAELAGGTFRLETTIGIGTRILVEITSPKDGSP